MTAATRGRELADDGSGKPVTITDAISREIQLSYTQKGLLSKVSLVDGRTVSYVCTTGGA